MRKPLLLLIAFCCAWSVTGAATKKAEQFHATITAGVKVGMPAEEVRAFLKAQKIKVTEFSNPRAITASIRHNQGLFGYSVSLASFRLDENGRVKEIKFNLDGRIGL